MAVHRKRVDVFLAPGELTVQLGSVNVKTIVGSCVAVCLWDAERHVGGVNHYLLARPGASEPPSPRYGTVAMAQLIEGVCRAGGMLPRLQAAVVGGGHPLAASTGMAVGDDNVALALEVLRARGIQVVRQETGGTHGRKLLFNPFSGELTVDTLRNWSGKESMGVQA